MTVPQGRGAVAGHPTVKKVSQMARMYTPFAMILATLIVTPTHAAPPDLQGIWARITFPGFGRPLTGPGPVVMMKNRGPDGRPTRNF
jgi:hypothetical protein